MLKSSLCDYSDAYILAKGTIIVPSTSAADAAANNANKNLIIEGSASFTDCISEVNNIVVDNAKDIDVVIPMYNLIEYNDNYSKTSRSLWQYYRDEPSLNVAGAIIDFPDSNNNNALFKFKEKITDQTGNDGTEDFEIIVPLVYLSNFWRTLKMPLINCEVNLILTWSANCFIMPNAN